MKRLTLICIFILSLNTNAFAQKNEIGLGTKNGSENERGTGAHNSTEQAYSDGVRWGIAATRTAVVVGTFGFIMYLASSDPSTFTHGGGGHAHSHSH